jgi:ankyrin repeat protein
MNQTGCIRSLMCVIGLAVTFTGCYRQSPEEAQALLATQEIPFTNYEFVRNAAKSPPGILALFINGNMHPNATTADGYTALIVAARVGNIPNINFLLQAGASVRPRTHGGITALMMAAQDCTHPESIRILLKAGAQATEQSDDGSTALTFATPPFGTGSTGCHPDVIQQLVKAGADPNHMNHHNWTPLMKAITNGSLTNVTTLLELGANPNTKGGPYGWPPLQAAVRQDMNGIEMVRALLKYHADPDATDKHNQSVLYIARGNESISQLLLKAGAAPLPVPGKELQFGTYPVIAEDLLLPIDCQAFKKALNLKLPCYGEHH